MRVRLGRIKGKMNFPTTPSYNRDDSDKERTDATIRYIKEFDSLNALKRGSTVINGERV